MFASRHGGSLFDRAVSVVEKIPHLNSRPSEATRKTNTRRPPRYLAPAVKLTRRRDPSGRAHKSVDTFGHAPMYVRTLRGVYFRAVRANLDSRCPRGRRCILPLLRKDIGLVIDVQVILCVGFPLFLFYLSSRVAVILQGPSVLSKALGRFACSPTTDFARMDPPCSFHPAWEGLF